MCEIKEGKREREILRERERRWNWSKAVGELAGRRKKKREEKKRKIKN